MPHIAPHGAWASPFSAADVAAGLLRLGSVALDGADVYWLEGRPSEGGRYALVRRTPDGTIADATPPDINVRSRVHEYGGGAYTVAQGVIYCVNFADQQVYRVLPDEPGSGRAAPRVDALTARGPWRYADLEIDAGRGRIICVREDHSDAAHEPVNALVSVPVAADDGRRRLARGRVLVSGADFYSAPRLAPGGSRLAWLSWNHPAMPWDATELWVASLTDAGDVSHATRVAGGVQESIVQPGWSPDGRLYFVSDRDGWWKLYRASARPGARGESWVVEPVVANVPAEAEFGRPQWVLGTATWACAGPSRILVAFVRQGRWQLGLVDAGTGMFNELAPTVHPHEWIAADATHAVAVAGFADSFDAIVRLDLATGAVERLREASRLAVDPAGVSVAAPVEFPTTAGRTAHAFYYPPCNPSWTAPPGDRPPLIVMVHGGPTTAARPTFDPFIQYWTTRGFAVADVNYGGSSGYGRAYRERLRGAWGVVDVDDVVSAAHYFSTSVSAGADPRRLIVRGGSAGGFTVLAALTRRPEVFGGGASYYGVCDLEMLARDTHKFEARYLDSLVGPYPAARALYRARSPVHAAGRLASALILFQGLDDRIVPPNQSQAMADAARANGVPVAYLAFDGEQHGFRRRETIVRCLEAELHFYSVVFGFAPADRLSPVVIENLP